MQVDRSTGQIQRLSSETTLTFYATEQLGKDAKENHSQLQQIYDELTAISRVALTYQNQSKKSFILQFPRLRL